ncbi:D-alanyl-D-alanine carboxypeptidase/D-alanyl-D-alanine-endopeptidase [Pseudoruegeria sp. SHC-113]|uniref:D-alanyl-D-alanine carboxypeptidase/D-alanyl-D-alanine endopeptidase n=1 Tax=Pseudoruegeria sp. SHC-113 TaxID=2855439 RepID=UPI0021BB9559|nr:D-alanyl-D-alanine carboxypeptidase/D-alanyl-D-alanine-endopeptidase [Pseudoruegeria sp. SHC-113]MCT8159753.1 D-alanyl-D-alanine carboxypeptidase/D-alanyl-D-alanine-endopeptidase [Pseudoruegeria sp. SHC-113]
MSHPISRRFFLGAALSGVATQAFANAPVTSLRPLPRGSAPGAGLVPSAEALIKASKIGGEVGFMALDSATGEVLEVHKPLLALPPASVAKSLTALYALDALGAEHRFRTQVLATGPLEGGRLAGDLILAGGGDPLLNTDDLGVLVDALKAAGLREVAGAFYVYSGALPFVPRIDAGQPDHLGYNPAVCGLNLNFNRVHFEWKRAGGSYAVSMDARAKRYNPAVSIAKMRVVDRNAPIYTYAAQGSEDHWTVARGALGNGGARWLPVRSPALYAGEVFRTIAASQGLKLAEAAPLDALPAGTVALAEQAGAPLQDVLRGMLKYSTNITAESAGLAASVARGAAPADLVQSAAAMSSWLNAGLGARHAALVDHSGLGDASRISARDMVKAMQNAPAGQLRPLLKEIPIRTERNEIIKGHPVRIEAKTGTLNFVSALAGYATTRKGRDLTFAIFTADLNRRDAIPLEARERPEGGREWARRSRRLQQALILRWATIYDTA